MTTTTEPYHHVRFRWWREIDFKKVSKELSSAFRVKRITRPDDTEQIIPSDDTRDELRITADTQIVLLSRFRAVLFQKTEAPLTSNDMRLRKRILGLYPRNRPTPFPCEVSVEP